MIAKVCHPGLIAADVTTAQAAQDQAGEVQLVFDLRFVEKTITQRRRPEPAGNFLQAGFVDRRQLHRVAQLEHGRNVIDPMTIAPDLARPWYFQGVASRQRTGALDHHRRTGCGVVDRQPLIGVDQLPFAAIPERGLSFRYRGRCHFYAATRDQPDIRFQR